MRNILVIGGSGIMGTAAIQAVRETYGSNAFIIANWYGKENKEFKIDGANHTLFGDITQSECHDSIRGVKGDQFDYLFYATAVGDVGFPIKNATNEQIERSNRLSFAPLTILEKKFQIRTIVSLIFFFCIIS